MTAQRGDLVARLALALAMAVGGVAWPAGGAPAPAAAGETLTCVPPDRIALVAGDRQYHRTGGAIDGAVSYSAAVRGETFSTGAPIDVALTIRNTGASPVTWSFATAQRFDAVFYDGKCREIWRWSRGRLFAQVLGSLTIAPGEIVTYRIRWDQRDHAGRQVGRDTYEVRVVFLGKRAPRAGPVVLSPFEFAVR